MYTVTMPPPPGRTRSIHRRNTAVQDAVANSVDHPKKTRKKRNHNVWKKGHLTSKGVPKTRVAKY